ncbi:hypothetical protein ACS0TY_035217 [Phlomoides rotata]
MMNTEEDEVLRLDLGDVELDRGSTRGFTAREIDKNLFSFQFNTEADMRAVLNRESWHFEKSGDSERVREG